VKLGTVGHGTWDIEAVNLGRCGVENLGRWDVELWTVSCRMGGAHHHPFYSTHTAPLTLDPNLLRWDVTSARWDGELGTVGRGTRDGGTVNLGRRGGELGTVGSGTWDGQTWNLRLWDVEL